MVIASGFAVRVKTGTRVRVVKFGGGGWAHLPRDGRLFRDAKELSQNNIVNLLIGLYRVIPFPVELIPCDADCS